MQRLFVTSILVNFLYLSYAQSDTLIKKQQKGFLFISAYNYRYDYDGGHMRQLGFHDFFYPSYKDFSLKDTVVYTGGIRIDFIVGRYGLKKDAIKVYGKDTSNCYNYDSFYVLPVVIDLKQYEDYEPFICRKNFYEFKTDDGKNLRFEYLHKAATIIRLTALSGKEKRLTNLKNSR